MCGRSSSCSWLSALWCKLIRQHCHRRWERRDACHQPGRWGASTLGGFNEKMCLNWWQLLSCLEASFKHSNDLELTRWSLFPCQDESVDAGLSHQLLGLMKRSKALRFYGLMGKRSGLQSSSCFFTAHKVVNNMNNICCRRKKAFPSAET